MTKLKKALEEVQTRLDTCKTDLRKETIQLGASSLDIPCGEDSAAMELKQRIAESDTKLKEQEQLAEKVISLQEKQTALQEERKELGEAKKESVERQTRLYEELGRKAFTVYRQGGFEENQFGDLFSRLTELSERRELLEQEIGDIEESRENSPLLKKIPMGAKISMSRSKLSTLEKELVKEYSALGKKLLEDEKHTILEDNQLLPLLAAWREARRKGEMAEERLEELLREEESLDTSLGELGAEKGGSKRLRELKDEQELIRRRRESLYYDYGAALLLATESRELIGKQGDAQQLDRVLDLETRQQELQDRSAALAAAIEAEEKGRTLEKEREHLEKITIRKKELESEIREQKKSISALESELNELNARAAAVEDSAE